MVEWGRRTSRPAHPINRAAPREDGPPAERRSGIPRMRAELLQTMNRRPARRAMAHVRGIPECHASIATGGTPPAFAGTKKCAGARPALPRHEYLPRARASRSDASPPGESKPDDSRHREVRSPAEDENRSIGERMTADTTDPLSFRVLAGCGASSSKAARQAADRWIPRTLERPCRLPRTRWRSSLL